MKSAYPKIFEPITIKRTTIKNRIAMTPMGTNYGETSGEMSNRHMNYYSLRAKGGVGLIILENANIEYPVGSNGTSQIRIDHDSYRSNSDQPRRSFRIFRKNRYGNRFFFQHPDKSRRRNPSPDDQRRNHDNREKIRRGCKTCAGHRL